MSCCFVLDSWVICDSLTKKGAADLVVLADLVVHMEPENHWSIEENGVAKVHFQGPC